MKEKTLGRSYILLLTKFIFPLEKRASRSGGWRKRSEQSDSHIYSIMYSSSPLAQWEMAFLPTQLQRQAGEMPRLQICISLALAKMFPSKKINSTATKGTRQFTWEQSKHLPFESLKRRETITIMISMCKSRTPTDRYGRHALSAQSSSRPSVRSAGCAEAWTPNTERRRTLRALWNIYKKWPQTRPQTKSQFQRSNITQTIFFDHAIILAIV